MIVHEPTKAYEQASDSHATRFGNWSCKDAVALCGFSINTWPHGHKVRVSISKNESVTCDTCIFIGLKNLDST